MMNRNEVSNNPDAGKTSSAAQCLTEFAGSAWSSAVTDKINGVRQLCGSKIEQQQQQPERSGVMQLSHIAGQSAGEIAFFLAASKLVGKGIKCAATRGAALEAGESVVAKSLLGQQVASASKFLNKSHLATELVTAGTTGALAGGVFKPVGNGESQWHRVGNAATEAATFMTLSGVTGKYGGTFAENLDGRMKLNALSGAAAGMVNTNVDAWTHGRVASAKDTVINGAGFAVGNVLTSEALHGVGRALENTTFGRKANVSRAGAGETVLLSDNSIPLNALTRDGGMTGRNFTARRVIDVAEAPVNPEVAKALEYQRNSTSPWLRTADATKRFPTLNGDINADTVVVGSGVVGQQIADRLAGLGQKVVVLERGKVASGTSGMMGAMNTFVPDTGFEVMAESFGAEKFPLIMQRLIAGRQSSENLGREFGNFKPVDSYNVGYSHNHEGIAAEAKIAQQFDPRIKFVTGPEAEKIFPTARSVAIFPQEGNLNPRQMLLGMASSGRYATFEDSPVLGLVKSNSGADVFTPEGIVHAQKVIFATNGPVSPFSYLNDHLTPVQCFVNTANAGRRMPGNFFDAPESDKSPFSYWRQFDQQGFKPDETLFGGTAHFLDTQKAVPFEPMLPVMTKRILGADGRDQGTGLIFTSYSDGVPIYDVHPQYPFMSIATGGGGSGLVGGSLLAQAAEMEAKGLTDALLSPNRFKN
ncbi:MAG TPA: FAD-dependent oxidoreductase [Trichormus sp.]